MSVLTGLISGAAKGAAKAGELYIDQALKKELLDIQEQKELRLAEARSRLEIDGYKAKGDYDTSQIGTKVKATADATLASAGTLGAAAAVQEAEAFKAGKPTRDAKFTEEQGNKKTAAISDANTYMDPAVQKAERAKAANSPTVMAANISKAISEGAVTLQALSDGRLMKVDKKGNSLGYLTDPDGAPVQGTRDITSSQLALAKSFLDEATQADKDAALDPAAAERAKVARQKGQNIIMYGTADGKPKSEKQTQQPLGADAADPMAAAGFKPPAAAAEKPKAEAPAPVPAPAKSMMFDPLNLGPKPTQGGLLNMEMGRASTVAQAKKDLSTLQSQYPTASGRPDGVAKRIAELEKFLAGAQ